MRSIVISSNTSGGGKTTFSLGLMKALMNRGYRVQGYKVGPDYIDTAFHTLITGNYSRNLDMYLMGEEGMKASFGRGRGDYGVVEGVMGLYDGRGIDTENSTSHMARVLGLPVLLVITPAASVATLCAEINGILNYENVNIVGIVFNNLSESYYMLLKAAIERNCGIKVFGYLPSNNKLELGSRHLGLIQSSEIEGINEKIQICSEFIEKYIDLNSLLNYFTESEVFEYCSKLKDNYHYENKGIRTAVAYDKAFSFYYRENIELLEELGEVVYFSPIKDKELPKGIDFLYIGGGYPEVYKEELSRNTSMRESINKALTEGLNCYAECGGLMYLTKAIDGYDMVSYFDGEAHMTSKLNNFGYASVSISSDNTKLPRELGITCHEFHTSLVNLNNNRIFQVSRELYDGSTKKWKCGYLKLNTLAGYAHVHFLGNMDFFKALLNI